MTKEIQWSCDDEIIDRIEIIIKENIKLQREAIKMIEIVIRFKNEINNEK